MEVKQKRLELSCVVKYGNLARVSKIFSGLNGKFGDESDIVGRHLGWSIRDKQRRKCCGGRLGLSQKRIKKDTAAKRFALIAVRNSETSGTGRRWGRICMYLED